MQEIKLSDDQLKVLADLQVEAARADLAQRYIGLVPIKWIWKNVLKLSDKEIKDFGDFGECGPECGHGEEDEEDRPPWK